MQLGEFFMPTTDHPLDLPKSTIVYGATYGETNAHVWLDEGPLPIRVEGRELGTFEGQVWRYAVEGEADGFAGTRAMALYTAEKLARGSGANGSPEVSESEIINKVTPKQQQENDAALKALDERMVAAAKQQLEDAG